MNYDLAVKTRDILSHVGRSDIRSAYYGNVSEFDYQKHEQRRIVADFILENRPPNTYLKVLSMPGLSWEFEQMILTQDPESHIVGIEKSVSIYLKSKRLMPSTLSPRFHSGRQRVMAEIFFPLSDRIRNYGRAQYHYARTGARFTSKKNRSAHRLLNMNMSTYSSMLITDYGQTADERNAFHSRFCNRTAVWLDFTGPISGEVDSCLRTLHLNLQAGCRVPVVITLLNARDYFRGAQARIDHLVSVQPLFEPFKNWTYVGKGGVSMLTVCGFIS